MHWTHRYSKRHPTRLKLAIRGRPKFTFGLTFKGTVKCTGKVLATVPLGSTGLELRIGPELKFKTRGKIQSNFTWRPLIKFGFTLNRHGFTHVVHKVRNGGGIDLTGRGRARLFIGLDAVVQTDGGAVGLGADVGPVISARVKTHSATGKTCWKGSLKGEADFKAFVRVFHFLRLTARYSKTFGKRKLGGSCSSGIVFDGSPGTGAPPPTLGPYTMQAFPADPTPEGTYESQVNGPTGPVTFGSALQHDVVGSYWATWSNGYTGDVYENDTVLPNGNLEVTVTLPPGTGAFYAYAEPNIFQDFSMSATAKNGPGSGPITVYGDAGAQYFGFYATCGHTLSSITYTDSGGDSAMAIGEFGIAPASSCQSSRS